MLFLILPSGAAQTVPGYFGRPARSLRRHVAPLFRVTPPVCLVASLIQGAFIYSCHFLILIIERGEMFPSYGRKVLAEERRRLWKYGYRAVLCGADNPPCKAGVVAVSGAVTRIDWNYRSLPEPPEDPQVLAEEAL